MASMSSRPLVAMDAVSLGGRLTGAGRALVNVLEHLEASDDGRDYIALATAAGAGVIRERVPGASVHEVAEGSGFAWELRGAGEAAATAGASLLFTVRELVPLMGPPAVVHVFEPPSYRLRAHGRPSVGEAKRVAKDVLLTAGFRRSVRRAAAVTAGSVTTAEWLARHARVEADVVISGIDPVFFEDSERQVAQPPYVLHPASGDPRENTDLVLRAFASGLCSGLRLVVFGTPADERERLEARARELGVDLELTGWVTDDELRRLYREATAFVHPSKYESYAGYPVLEAMALGTPVVVLDAPGVTEAVGGGRGLLIREESPEELGRAIALLRDDPALAARLVAAAQEHARTLTWSSAAARLSEVFGRVLDQSPQATRSSSSTTRA
jgi:glycosyltransferase involved in cell wall biosynthesis